MKKVSIIVRTYNEEKYLPQLLDGIASQNTGGLEVEVILVDSGSTDGTVGIAESHGAKVLAIRKEDFTFGRSLNIGCAAATGDALVFVSGHCIPAVPDWLLRLTEPLFDGAASYAYGRQLGWKTSRFSERQIFSKYYPACDKLQDTDFFCNNANSAILRRVWQEFRFDEALTGLEDMELGLRLVGGKHRIAYVASASVYHIHEEAWPRVKVRYEREAIALQRIMPQVHISFSDFLRYFASAVFYDVGASIQQKKFLANFGEILLFRFFQFWGTYRGNHEHRKISTRMKEQYFYPK